MSFPLFSTFPTEIQDLIWSHAVSLTPPRIIELRLFDHKNCPPYDGSWAEELSSSAPIPSLLHTNQASRAAAKKRWTLALPGFKVTYIKLDEGKQRHDGKDTSRVWFDFDTDILLFLAHGSMLKDPMDWQDLPYDMIVDDRAKVKNLAIDFTEIVAYDFRALDEYDFQCSSEDALRLCETYPVSSEYRDVLSDMVRNFPAVRTIYLLPKVETKYEYVMVKDEKLVSDGRLAAVENVFKKVWEEEGFPFVDVITTRLDEKR